MPVSKRRIWHHSTGDAGAPSALCPRTGGGGRALLLSPSRRGDMALPGRMAGSRPQSAVAQGHLCWLPMPSARGEVGGSRLPSPRPGQRAGGQPGEATADSLHPGVLALPPPRGGRRRRAWGQPPHRFLPGSTAIGLGRGILSPLVGCQGGDRLHASLPGWLHHRTPCCLWISLVHRSKCGS